MKNHGYSLLEMLFVLALAAAAIVSSVPFLVQYAENSQFESAAQKVVSQVRRTKMLAVTKKKTHTICVPLGEANDGNLWKFFTLESGRDKCDAPGTKIIEDAIPYKIFQKSGKTEIKKIVFTPRGTSTNKSFCIENKRGGGWKKITISNFARITVISDSANPCD